MPESVEFKPSLEEIRRRIRRRGAEMVDLTVPNKQIAVFLDSWVQRNFRTEGGSIGGWAPFKAGGRARRGGGIDPSAKLLQDTGRLRISFDPFFDRQQVGIGSPISYSKYHEFGTRNVPKRRMLPEESDVIGTLLRIFNRHLDRLARKRLR